jgi:putative flavoprotein involved in K+ transport
MIAVIGAGPAGLASAAMLRRSGREVVVLERSEVGAAWRTRYDRLHLHTVRWLSCLPGYRMPRSFGKWPARDRVIDYLRLYADRHGLDVRTGVEVRRLDRHGDGWTITTNGEPVEAERVVVASGYCNVPFVPEWPGGFAGGIVHSSEYRNPAPYAGRRVLVVGSGNSGAEIAVDVATGGAAKAFLAVRTPPAIFRRDVLGFPSQLIGLATQRLPVPVLDRIGVSLRRLSVPDLAPYGLPAPARPYSDFRRKHVIPILDVGLVEAVRSGQVEVVPALERFDGPSAVLAGGRRVEVDAVIASTGYRTGLEPIVGHLGILDERGEPLVHGAEEHPAAPGLHFVGFVVELGGAFRYAGLQAKRLTRRVAAA